MAKLGGDASVWGSDGKRYDPGMDVPAAVAKGWSNPDIVWDGDAPEDGDRPPARNEPKAAWVDWAVSQGADRAAAEAMSKDALVAEYGP
jgi:hypothetical protein